MLHSEAVGEDTELFAATGMPDRDWWEALWPNPRQTLATAGVRAGMDVVDLCCGDGYFTAALARLVAPGRVYAVDMLESMLAQARAETARAGVTNVTFVRADARHVDQCIGDPVDLVLIANTFHGVDAPTELARAVREVLRPGGRFVVINWYPRPREETPVLGKPRGPRDEMRMAPEAVRAVVEAGGLREVDVVAVGPYHYASIFERPPEVVPTR